MQRIFESSKVLIKYSTETHALRQNLYQIQQSITKSNFVEARQLITSQKDALGAPDAKKKYDKIFYDIMEAKVDFFNFNLDGAKSRYQKIIEFYEKNATALHVERKFELGQYGSLEDFRNTLEYISALKLVNGIDLTLNEKKQLGIVPTDEPLHIVAQNSIPSLSESLGEILTNHAKETGRNGPLIQYLVYSGKQEQAIELQKKHLEHIEKIQGRTSRKFAIEAVYLVFILNDFEEIEQLSAEIIPNLAHSIHPEDKKYLHSLLSFLAKEYTSIDLQRSINFMASARACTEVASVQWLRDSFELISLVLSYESDQKSVKDSRRQLLTLLIEEIQRECKTPNEEQRVWLDLIDAIHQMDLQNFNASYIKLAHLSEKDLPEAPWVNYFRAWCQYNRGNTKIAVDLLTELTEDEVVGFKASHALHYIKRAENSTLTSIQRRELLTSLCKSNRSVNQAFSNLEIKGVSHLFNGDAWENIMIVENAIYDTNLSKIEEENAKKANLTSRQQQFAQQKQGLEAQQKQQVQMAKNANPGFKVYQPRGQYNKPSPQQDRPNNNQRSDSYQPKWEQWGTKNESKQ